MKRSGWILSIIVVVVLLAAAAAMLLTGQESAKDTDDVLPVNETATMQPDENAPSEALLLIGDKDAPITIVDYADFKCPNCNKLHQGAMKDIRKKYVETGKVNIEFRPFPLFGEDSGLALYASYCAAEQGKFEAYHDKMFEFMWTNYYKAGDYSAETKTLFSPEKLGSLAGEAGLDAATFTACAAGKQYAEAYNAAVMKAAADEVQSAPSIIIGTQKVVGPQPYSTYDALLKIEAL